MKTNIITIVNLCILQTLIITLVLNTEASSELKTLTIFGSVGLLAHVSVQMIGQVSDLKNIQYQMRMMEMQHKDNMWAEQKVQSIAIDKVKNAYFATLEELNRLKAEMASFHGARRNYDVSLRESAKLKRKALIETKHLPGEWREIGIRVVLKRSGKVPDHLINFMASQYAAKRDAAQIAEMLG